MKNILVTSILILSSFMGTYAQSIVGDWEGSLEVQGTTLKIIFHINETDGKYSSTLDSPNQGAFDIEMDETTVEGKTLTIKKTQMGMETNATYNAEKDVISGNFKQGPMDLPLELQRVKMEEANETAEAISNHPMAGDWNSELNVMGTQLRLIFHVTEKNGEFTTTMDSPDQSAFGMEVNETTVDGNKISLSAKQMGIAIEGTLVPDSNLINANFRQATINENIVLTRESIAKKEVNRPQEPKTFDYKQEEVKFTNPIGGHSLSGTLTIPKSGKFNKVVVLVSGSGPQDRNEELIGHKPFLVLSDYLTRHDVAVLRYDDRGVGKSEGDFKAGTSMDFADDATSAVNYLRKRSDMKGKKIGIMGHSEGGLIAPIVADKIDLDFIVLLAGPGADSDELLLEQTAAIQRASGVEESMIEKNGSTSRLMFEYMNNHQSLSVEDLRKGLVEILKPAFESLSAEEKEEIGDMDQEIKNQVESISSPWFRYFLNYKPSDYLSKVTIPVLAVNGSLDLQVLPGSNLSAIEENLKIANNENYTIKQFAGLNHLFQVSLDGTGSPSEYGSIEETFNEGAMNYITDWVLNYDK